MKYRHHNRAVCNLFKLFLFYIDKSNSVTFHGDGDLPHDGSEKTFSVETGDELHRLNAMLTWIRETKVMTDLHC